MVIERQLRCNQDRPSASAAISRALAASCCCSSYCSSCSATNSINPCTYQPSSCCNKPKRRRRPLVSAGAGSVIDAAEDYEIEQWHLPKQWLRQLDNGQIDSLKLLSVSGDPMVPRLLHGDIVMIDTSQRTASPPEFLCYITVLGWWSSKLSRSPTHHR